VTVFRRLILLGLFLLFVTACTSTIRLRNPDGRMATCGGTWMFGASHFAAAERDRNCVADFQRQGYERVGDSE